MARRKAEPKATRVLSMNTSGHLTYCTSPIENRGKGRCNHLAHQEENETPQDFMKRANIELEKINKGEIQDERKPLFDYKTDEDGVMQSIKFETKPYRMTDEEKENAVEIYGRLQLDNDYEDKDLYIELETPLWNDVDVNYYASLTNNKPANIRSVLIGETEIVVESTDENFPAGSILTPFRTNKIKENQKESGIENIKFGTGVEALNIAAKANGFEATKNISVIPYNMRPSSDVIDHPLTTAYKYILNRRKNPQNQQMAYMALLNNSALNKDLQRYNDGYSQPSLADEFVGKSGVFRKYLSGRSVPYAGRAIIDPSTDVAYGEVKIPAPMAIDIFKPSLIKEFLEEGKTEDEFDEYVAQFRKNDVTDLQRKDLEDRITKADVRVLMNRQPSSHLGNLQSYKPRISGGHAVMIHPMYAEAYGGDHDGDAVNIIGINNKEISKIADKSLDAKLDINTKRPRRQSEYQVLPQKDVLYGLLSILKQRSK